MRGEERPARWPARWAAAWKAAERARRSSGYVWARVGLAGGDSSTGRAAGPPTLARSRRSQGLSIQPRWRGGRGDSAEKTSVRSVLVEDRLSGLVAREAC